MAQPRRVDDSALCDTTEIVEQDRMRQTGLIPMMAANGVRIDDASIEEPDRAERANGLAR